VVKIETNIFDLFPGQQITHIIKVFLDGKIFIQMPILDSIFDLPIHTNAVNLQFEQPLDHRASNAIKIFGRV